MADRLLRHIPSGILYVSQPAFEIREDFEPVEPVVAEPPAPADVIPEVASEVTNG